MEGLFHVRKPEIAGFLLFINIFLPRFGTILSARCADKDKDKEEENLKD
jgi:hypothetical protein